MGEALQRDTAQNILPLYQADLFFDSLSSNQPIKDDQSLMAYPFFAITKQPSMTPIFYNDGNVKIKIEPGSKGIATIYDKEVLIYLSSIINEKLERGEAPSPTILFKAHDFLVCTGRGTGKRAYDLFMDALFRLRSTTITTDIQSGNERERNGFGWIDTFRIHEREVASGRKLQAAVEIRLNPWMMRALTKDRRILTINPDYFKLKGGIERRIYEIARKHCGTQPEWSIRLEKLREKCGVNNDIYQFKRTLKKIMSSNSLPDYAFVFFQGKKEEMVRFWPTRKAKEVSQSGEEHPYPSEQAMTTARRKHPEGWNFEVIAQEWQQWASKQADSIKDVDAAFLGFCTKFIRNNSC